MILPREHTHPCGPSCRVRHTNVATCLLSDALPLRLQQVPVAHDSESVGDSRMVPWWPGCGRGAPQRQAASDRLGVGRQQSQERRVADPQAPARPRTRQPPGLQFLPNLNPPLREPRPLRDRRSADVLPYLPPWNETRNDTDPDRERSPLVHRFDGGAGRCSPRLPAPTRWTARRSRTSCTSARTA